MVHTDLSHREQTCGCQWWGGEDGEGWEREFGVSKCKLYIEWKNKVLLYSTENYIVVPVINHNGKEYVCYYSVLYV